MFRHLPALLALFLLASCASIPMEDAPDVSPLHPFGAHDFSYAPGGIMPDHLTAQQLSAATATFYEGWKGRHLATGCGEKRYYILTAPVGPDGKLMEETITVSEAQGYGMIVFALMAGHDPQARRYFDGMYRYFRDHPSKADSGLMAWNQVEGCRNKPGGGSHTATDGDLDIAYALLLADRQWGSNGPIDYLKEARGVMDAILDEEVNQRAHYPHMGTYVTRRHRDYRKVRTSDLMPGHFRAFAAAGGDAEWRALLDNSYGIIDGAQRELSPATGLLPDFLFCDGGDVALVSEKGIGGEDEDEYSYNANRVPWRVGVDYLLTGDARAKAALERINRFIRAASGDDPAAIVNGYALSGEPKSKRFGAAFAGPFLVGMMAGKENQQFLNRGWDLLAARPLEKEGYYGSTMKLLSMLVISGNWWGP